MDNVICFVGGCLARAEAAVGVLSYANKYLNKEIRYSAVLEKSLASQYSIDRDEFIRTKDSP